MDLPLVFHPPCAENGLVAATYSHGEHALQCLPPNKNDGERMQAGRRGRRWQFVRSEQYDPGRIRACNLWFRPMPYPLSHRASCSNSRRYAVLNKLNCFWSRPAMLVAARRPARPSSAHRRRRFPHGPAARTSRRGLDSPSSTPGEIIARAVRVGPPLGIGDAPRSAFPLAERSRPDCFRAECYRAHGRTVRHNSLSDSEIRIRYSLAGQDTRPTPERPGFESRWRNVIAVASEYCQ